MLSNKSSISTFSLGQHPSHTLDQKIRLAAQYGFSGIEVVYTDLKNYSEARSISIQQGAEQIRTLCAQLKLTILSLAPFENFEGHSSPFSERFSNARHWIDIARILGATYLQVPAQYDKNCTGDRNVIVSELRQLTDLGNAQQPEVAIAYEPMSWSINHSTWESALDLIEAIDRPNFGLCLDSFHIITKLWASPFTASGKYPDADAALRDSLTRFIRDCPMDRLFYIQVSDGERFNPPFSDKHPWYTDGEAPEFTWSKHARPFPLEMDMGGYMPVVEFLRKTVVEKGFDGWVGLEIFDRRMRDERFKPEIAAMRAQESWKKLIKGLGGEQSRL